MTMTAPEQRVLDLAHRHGWSGDPRELVVRLCRELLDESGETVPVDLSVVASFQNVIRIEEVDQLEAGHLRWDGAHFVICVRRSDPVGRRRFSAAHELVHTFFEEDGPHATGMVQHEHEGHSELGEEHLCDVGAAELCMPYATFLAAVSADTNFGDLSRIADQMMVSLEAAAHRFASLLPHPTACVVLEPKYTKAEQKLIQNINSSPVLPGMDAAAMPTSKFRVTSSRSYGLGFIPRNKSVSEIDLAATTEFGELRMTGRTGLVKNEPLVQISAIRAPYSRNGTRQERVILLMVDTARAREVDRFLAPHCDAPLASAAG